LSSCEDCGLKTETKILRYFGQFMSPPTLKCLFHDRIPLTDKLLQPTKMTTTTEKLKLAESVRKACLENLQRSYEQAGISGLCHEGRWEYALDVLRNLSMENLLKDISRPHRPSRRTP
jgi:pentatricopeptide repeat protein